MLIVRTLSNRKRHCNFLAPVAFRRQRRKGLFVEHATYPLFQQRPNGRDQIVGPLMNNFDV
jgi:hypothetical protein